MTTKNTHILVTGGAGFIGHSLCLKLLKDGHTVTCLDNEYTGSTTNLAPCFDYSTFHYIHHDVEVPIDLEVDAIYNLACPASPVHYQHDPIKTTKTSVIGILNLLELAKKQGATLLQASTSEVYGDPTIHPQPETYFGNVNPIGIRSCYDEGKRMAESLCFDYFRMHQVPIRVARIFNTYGPNMRMDDGRVISNFIVQALTEMPITIYGEGQQTRSFCFVSDMISGLTSLMTTPMPNPEPINLGNPAETTILDIAKKIIALTNSNSAIEFKPLPSDDPKQRKPSIIQAQKRLNWTPKTSLDDGLKITINYFQSLLESR